MTGISNEKMMKIIDQKNIELAEDYKTKGNIIVKKYQNEIESVLCFFERCECERHQYENGRTK